MQRLIVCGLIAAFPAAHAADVVATLPIDHVTVYRDSAIITRAGTVDLAAGDHRLIVRNLPDGLVPAGIRIAAKGGKRKRTSKGCKACIYGVCRVRRARPRPFATITR